MSMNSIENTLAHKQNTNINDRNKKKTLGWKQENTDVNYLNQKNP